MWLFVCRYGPADTVAVRELADMAMVALAFGQPMELLLIGDGVRHSQQAQSPLSELLAMMPSPPALEAAAIKRLELERPDRALDEMAIRQLFHDADQLVMF
jgi:sulfur relay (sulfurtransferase) DsrF/TusC family protein